MKKSIGIIYISVFMTACCIPLIASLIHPQTEVLNKEDTAHLPVIIDNGKINQNIGKEFDDYFTKSIPFRSQMITAENKISSGILQKENNNVITGTDGWLFTKESADEYIGIQKNNRAIHNIAETVRIIQESAQAQGANFVFTVAPDKNQIYSEYMPKGYLKSESNTLTVLEKYLKDDKINYVDLKEELLKHKENQEEIYLKTDTHWNGLGALYGYHAIMNGLGGKYENFSGVSYTVRNDWYGDIAKMLYPEAPVACRQYYFDIDDSSVRFIQPRTMQSNQELLSDLMSDKEENDIIIRTLNPKGKNTVYISRDSFGRAMLPFLITNYRSAYITRTRTFDINNQNYTDMIYEIVERKLDSVTDSAPMIDAPEVSKINGKEIQGEIHLESNQGITKIYGLLDENTVKDDSEIYLRINFKDGEKYFAAFPICETTLLGLPEKSEYGFSAMLRTNELLEQSQISILIQ